MVKFNQPQNKSSRVLNPMEEWIVRFITDSNMYVMRRKRDNAALNCSYSDAGLQWTMDPYSRNPRKLLYFKNAELRHYKVNGIWSPYFFPLSQDGLDLNPDVVIEKFIPTNHYFPNGEQLNARLQVPEYRISNKALRMLYGATFEGDVQDARLVYSTSPVEVKSDDDDDDWMED